MTKARNLADFISDATVATAEIADNAITPDKLQDTGNFTLNNLNSTGNITVTGTVDGRDVAADGIKLDGIEASADVTDTTNVTAAGALMTTGGSLTGNISLGDNNKAIFGAGSDLQIYHDGSNSIIKDNGAGDLRIMGSDDVRIVDAVNEENMARFNRDGAVTLYYNNAAKIATSSTGIDVTGSISADGLTVDGDAQINSTFPRIFMMESDTTDENAAVMSSGGDFKIFTVNDAKSVFTQRFNIDHATGDISFYDTDGTTASFVYDASAGTTFNEAGADRDFRIESDSNSHMLFVDAGNNRIGINAASPQKTLEVVGDIQLDATDASLFLKSGVTGTSGYVNWTFNTDATVFAKAGIDYDSRSTVGFHLDSGYPISLDAVMTSTRGLDILNSGSLIHRINTVESAFNENSLDHDFRVESDTNTHALFVDASAGIVSVFNPSPVAKYFQVGGDTITTRKPTMSVSGGDSGGVDTSLVIRGGSPTLAFDQTGGGSTRILMDSAYINFLSGDLDTFGNNIFKLASLSGQTTVFNEDGINLDFRIESLDKEKMLFVDGGENVVAMGMSNSYTTPSWIGNGSVVMADNFYQFQGASTSAGVWNQSVDTNQSYHMHNAYYSSGWKQHVANVSATMYQSGSGLHRFQVANANATADQAISWRVLLNMNEADGFHWNANGYSTADFRVQSDSNTHALFVDAGSSEVGINNDTPDAALHVKTTANNVALFDSSHVTSTQAFIRNSNAVTGTYALLGWAPANDVSGAYIQVNAQEDFSTAANRTADMEFYTRKDGNWYQRLYMDHSATIFNENSTNTDFRVESDTNAHALFVDAGNNRIGLFNSSPSAPLHLLAGSSGGSLSDAVQIGDGTYTNIAMYSGGADGEIRIGAAGVLRGAYKAQYAGTRSANDFHVGVQDTTGMFSIDGAGAALIINERGADTDFRVESDGQTHMFFVDAGQNLIGIGQSSNLHGNRLNIEKSDSQTDGPEIVMKNLYQASSGTDELGSINFGGWRDVASTGSYTSAIGGYDVTYPGTSGQLRFFTKSNGNADPSSVRDNAHEMMRITDNAVILNEHSADNDFRVESDTQSHMLFVNAGTNRVGINTSDPNATLGLNGNFRFEGTNPVALMSGFHDGTNCFKFDSNTTVGSGSLLFGFFNNGAQKVRVEGNGDLQNVNNSYGAISDKRLKENIGDASSQWDDIKAVQVRKFSLIEDELDDANMIGVIAQELEASGMGNLVDTSNDPATGEEYKAVKYSILYMKAIKALQEAITKIETLEAKVTALENA